jgi:hypothetical protein
MNAATEKRKYEKKTHPSEDSSQPNVTDLSAKIAVYHAIQLHLSNCRFQDKRRYT